MTTDVNHNARTSATLQIERDAGASNSPSEEVRSWVASSHQVKVEGQEIAQVQAEVTKMKSLLMRKRQEIELLQKEAYSDPSPTTQEDFDLRNARSMRLHRLVGETESLVKGIEARTQGIMAAQAIVLIGLSTDAIALQEINNTLGEIRSMQVEYEALTKGVASIMKEAARHGELDQVQGLKLEESLDRMKFLRGSIDAQSGHVVAAQDKLIEVCAVAIRSNIEQ